MSHEESSSSASPPKRTRIIHTGRRFQFEQVVHTSLDGTELVRDIVRHPGAVVILPVLDDGRIVFVRQYRAPIDGELWELPAGTLDQPEEPPINCAKRELEEETGYRGGQIEPLGRFYTTPGLTDELMHAFIATELKAVGRLSLEPGEDISVSSRRPDEVVDMIQKGELCDGKSMLAILLARERLGIDAKV